jgi:hypothetical protein
VYQDAVQFWLRFLREYVYQKTHTHLDNAGEYEGEAIVGNDISVA